MIKISQPKLQLRGRTSWLTVRATVSGQAVEVGLRVLSSAAQPSRHGRLVVRFV